MSPQMTDGCVVEPSAVEFADHFTVVPHFQNAGSIENAADNASVPQALNLLNGPLVEALTNPYSVLGAEVKAAATLEEKTRVIFQAMLTREPTVRELELVGAEVAQFGESAHARVVWALFNTQQFRFLY